MKHLDKLIFLTLLSVISFACGGGGGGGDSTATSSLSEPLNLTKPDVDVGDFLFIHLDTVMGNGNYLVTMSDNLDIQETTKNNIYMTNIIVLKNVAAAGNTFEMGHSSTPKLFAEATEVQHNVTFSSNFYMGVYEITQKQWLNVMGNNPSEWSDASVSINVNVNPVESVTYNDIRGDAGVYKWPSSTSVDSASFVGKLRAKTGLNFDLPTEAEWEYTCKAGTSTPTYSGNSAMGNVSELSDDLLKLCFFIDNNPGVFDVKQTTGVGGLLPNAWGFYDMLGNVYEWCVDNYVEDLGKQSQTDPVGSGVNGVKTIRGGAYGNSATEVRSAWRSASDPGNISETVGFRLYLKNE